MSQIREIASGLQFPEGPIAMADGSVHILTAEEIAEKLPAMLTIAGNDDPNSNRSSD